MCQKNAKFYTDVLYKAFTSCYRAQSLKFKVGAFHERFVKRTKKMYGPNPKTFRVGPYTEFFSLRRRFVAPYWAERIPTLKDRI